MVVVEPPPLPEDLTMVHESTEVVNTHLKQPLKEATSHFLRQLTPTRFRPNPQKTKQLHDRRVAGCALSPDTRSSVIEDNVRYGVLAGTATLEPCKSPGISGLERKRVPGARFRKIEAKKLKIPPPGSRRSISGLGTRRRGRVAVRRGVSPSDRPSRAGYPLSGFVPSLWRGR